MKRFALVALLVLGFALRSSQTAAQTTPALIRFGAAPDVHAVPLLYARKAGLYAKYGLDVELIKFSNAAAATAALVGGSLDMSKTSALGIVNAISKGLPLTVIGSIGYYDADRPDHALVVAADSSIRTAKDLEGKTLSAISLQDLETMTTFGWLDQRGVDHSTLKYVEIPAAATLAAMTQNQVVGSTVSEPFFSADMNSGKVRILGYPYSALGRHFATAVLFADKAWVETHRDLVTRFLKATQEASVYVAAHENSDELRELMAQYAGVDPEAIKNQRSPGRGVILAPGDLQSVIDYAAKYKVIPKAFPAQDVICSCALRK